MFKHTIDGAALSVSLATFMGYLPPLAALASIIWTSIQVYEWYKRKQNAKSTKGV
jgi:hypothetical protein